MEYYYIRFTTVWICWFIFADKRRWRELLPVCFFASLLGAVTDTINHHYHLWMYDYSVSLTPELLDDFGIYIVVTYLFIQWLPKTQTLKHMGLYWLVWTSVSISIEYIHTKSGHLTYHQWWTIYHSYVADWILFWTFYKYHRIFQFKRLSNVRKE